jgi:hypothetical protein
MEVRIYIFMASALEAECVSQCTTSLDGRFSVFPSQSGDSGETKTTNSEHPVHNKMP